MSTYEPGTVAIATVRGVKGIRVMSYSFEDGVGWASATEARGEMDHADHVVTDVRPLVVLDLAESKGGPSLPTWLRNNVYMVEKGSVKPTSIGQDMHWLADQIEAQTRPPRIPEPGLWGVVTATAAGYANRANFVRQSNMEWGDTTPWLSSFGKWFAWSDLVDPTLIREGVES